MMTETEIQYLLGTWLKDKFFKDSLIEVVEPIPVPELEKLKAEIQPAFTAPKQEVKKIIVQRGGTGKLKQQKQDKYKKHRK